VTVRVRIALLSYRGTLHIGTRQNGSLVRLFARHHGGRLVTNSEIPSGMIASGIIILPSTVWCGLVLTWGRRPIFQSAAPPLLSGNSNFGRSIAYRRCSVNSAELEEL